MNASRQYIPWLIVVALLGLIGLQLVWLLDVYRYKQQELNNKTREALLATTQRLQRDEDAKLIIRNMDSLLTAPEQMAPELEKDVRAMVSNIKSELSIETDDDKNGQRQEMQIISDSANSTTIVSIASGVTRKMTIRSVSSKAKAKSPHKKAKKLEQLFLKMAANAGEARKNIDARVDSQKVKSVLNEELRLRGINMEPQYEVYYSPRDTRKKTVDYHVLFSSTGIAKVMQATITMPLFPDDVFGGDLFIKVGYLSTKNFVIRQMTGLLLLSLLISLLVGFVMIYIFRRLLSQEKLHRLKNDFINNMTHELKTPIATISLALDAINNPQIKNDENRFKEYTRILKEENQKMNAHVEQVLQMAQLDRGELRLQQKPVNLCALWHAAIARHGLQIENQHAVVNFMRSAENIMITGDELHLGNVFNNLLDNALKYCRDTCVVNISLADEGDRVQVRVRDNGIGIDQEQQQRVFEKFYRAQGGNLHDVKGFGLGLSYVKSVVEAHGGTIELKSEKGNGTEFVLWFRK